MLDGGDPLTGAAEDAAILISLAFPDRIAQRRDRSNRYSNSRSKYLNSRYIISRGMKAFGVYR